VKSLQRPLKWLVITEHWCGDASQINPVINKIAIESEGKIELRFIYRDQNSDLMDAFLTDGRSRSIPMLIQLDKDFNFLAQYGPRPAEAQKLVKASLAKQAPYDLPLHTWYAKDKQNSLQDDLLQIIK
jgi:thioredoxin-like negative regulator of GroEL